MYSAQLMKALFQMDPDKLISHALSSDRETLLYKLLPHFFGELISTYFRVTVEGTENLPRRGPALILPNHSGVSGFDAMVLHHEIQRAVRRFPRVLTHHLWFLTKTTAIPASRLGFVEATTDNGLKFLNHNQMVVLFPVVC